MKEKQDKQDDNSVYEMLTSKQVKSLDVKESKIVSCGSHVGKTALDIALEIGHMPIVRLLRSFM